ncbi:MAG: phosphatase PAP2 family protein [Christensenellales bacterium]|jgi:membrane-associated phospholipid phosphatase|nr:phosphatase PAP2 family protein [Clostridiales bacterium]
MTKKIDKKTLIILICSAAVFIGLMILAAFMDLKINILLQNPDSLYGQSLEYLGEFPAYVAAGVAFIILFQAVTKDSKYYLALKILFGILAFVGVGVFVNYLMGKFFKEEIMYRTFYLIVFTIVATALAMLGTAKADKQVMKKLALFAVMLLAVLAISQIITTIAKKMWGRMRFRNMNQNYDGYTPWYKLNFGSKGREHLVVSDPYHSDSDAFRSFPSGHTSAAGLSIALVLLPDLFEKLKKYKVWFYVAPITYTLLVALSRIIVKAHFLSDVLAGFIIAVGSVFFSRWIILLIDNKIKQKKRQAE